MASLCGAALGKAAAVMEFRLHYREQGPQRETAGPKGAAGPEGTAGPASAASPAGPAVSAAAAGPTGPDSPRPPLVLLHGNGEDGSYFVHQIEYFSAHYQVLAPDTRGHGKTPRRGAERRAFYSARIFCGEKYCQGNDTLGDLSKICVPCLSRKNCLRCPLK